MLRDKYRLVSLLTAIILLVSCASNRTTTTKLIATVKEPETRSGVIRVPPPRLESLDASDRLELLLTQAEIQFDRGEELFKSGEREDGRKVLKEALQILSSVSGTMAHSTRLSQKKRELEQRMKNLEIQALAEDAEFPVFNGDSTRSPLDEIADLNLYMVEVDPGLELVASHELHRLRFDIPIVLNHRVLTFLDYYRNRGRRVIERGLFRSGAYLPLFREIFAEEGTPLDLVYMAQVESLFNPRALSRARALGLWQFMSETARLYGLRVDWWVDERMDIVKSTRAAARHLNDLYDEFGDWYLALAAYNAGAGRVSRILKRHGPLDYWTMCERGLLPRETQNFVPSILAAILIYRSPSSYGFEIEPAAPLQFEKVQVDFQIDINVIAESAGIPIETLFELNPQLRRAITPGDPNGYEFRVPLGSAHQVLAAMAEIPPEKRLRFHHHRVQRGDTLSRIASRYGTTIQAVAEVNQIKNIHRLSLGQELIIPVSDWKATVALTRTSGGSYTVKKGDSLYAIARLHGVDLDDLVRWNDLSPSAVIHPGQEIKLSADAE
ncbi:MAG TPA: LysM peptidoglycan-binding domain-containing protein [Acidobacteriota bacterium]|nr:LysM peptidoglycan-binding domain-containing protein [Acidobacteriota bacterium]